MQALDSFLEHHVEKLVLGQHAPIDLLEVAQRVGAVVEEREMIPEAAMAPDGSGFRIYLQSNFLDLPGSRMRQRFSLAHELAHTFFFEPRDGVLKPRRDTPTGDRLEGACQKGAALLLVPPSHLVKELRAAPDAKGADCILQLAEHFDVSIEVLMRRLWDLDAFGDELAPVLTRRASGSSFTIEYAVYPPWLKTLLAGPQRGSDFGAWFGGSKPERIDGDRVTLEVLVRGTPQGRLTAQPVDVSPSLRIFELRLSH